MKIVIWVFLGLLLYMYIMRRRKRTQGFRNRTQGFRKKQSRGKSRKASRKKRQSRKKNVPRSHHPTIRNIYGQPLKKCQKSSSDTSGSWDSEGYCSEKGGGVHQICMDVTDKSQDFATHTHQSSNWSKDRVNKNHCMCLGAWSLYKARQNEGEILPTEKELHCEAIPDMSLSKEYTGKWNTWNGREKPQQIVAGINALVDQCYDHKPSKHLKKRYCNIATDEFKDTDTYRRLCDS